MWYYSDDCRGCHYITTHLIRRRRLVSHIRIDEEYNMLVNYEPGDGASVARGKLFSEQWKTRAVLYQPPSQ